jgi:aminopeptidase N
LGHRPADAAGIEPANACRPPRIKRYRAMKTDMPRPIRLKDYRPPSHLIDAVDLDVMLDPTATRVRARLEVRPNPASDAPATRLRLDGEQLALASVALDGRALAATDYLVSEAALTLPAVPDRAFTLEIVTVINPDANKALQGLYRSRGIYCSQCEAQGFRRITYFLDRPDVLSVYRVRLEADRAAVPVLLANGNPVERGQLDRGRRHYAVWKDPHPKPCYLFAMVGGNLASIASTFRTMSGREVDLRIYVEPGKEARAAWALDSLKRAMRWDERRFGREYDLDVFNIVAVSDFNMGAMENKGLNVFNDRLILASAETATDAMYEAIESVVAHEYFHNWTGNRITCRDWFQLCLKEGLTVYRDQEFSADERSATVQRIVDVRHLRATQFPEDAGPLAHPVRPESYIEINNFYTPTVYEKGAELVRMIETILGRDSFRKGMDLYFARHDGEAATIEQFIACFEEASGQSLAHFSQWYGQSGTPELVCRFAYDAARQSAELEIDQINPATPDAARKKPLHIPLRLGLIGPDGRDLALRRDGREAVGDGLLAVTKRSQTFRFADLPVRPVPSLLRGFSAPVNLTIDVSDADLAFLMAHDSDLFNRWQAANTYATRLLAALARSNDVAAHAGRIRAFAAALGATIGNDGLEPAFRAEMLRLPGESDIAREIAQNVDPAAIHRARVAMLKLIGRALGRQLEDLYRRLESRAPFSPDAASAGRRALRNVILSVLSARRGRDDVARLLAHFGQATSMTDEAHALMLLAASTGAARSQSLAAFFDRWQRDHLVIDTWFTAQALAPQAATLARVRALTHHPLFALTAPNKVRALIGAFAASNPVQFNRPDGRSYRFVADQVLAIDRFNPQVASRLAGSFRSWRTLEPGRRKLARQALATIARSKGLSRDVFELVSKMRE